MSTSFVNPRPFQFAFPAAVLSLVSAAWLSLGAIAPNAASAQQLLAQSQPVASPQAQPSLLSPILLRVVCLVFRADND